MSSNPIISNIRAGWMKRLILKSATWVVAVALFSVIVAYLSGQNLWIMVGGGLISMVLIIFEMRKAPVEADIVRLVNEQLNSTEYSTELILRESVSGLNAIQQKRVHQALSQKIPTLTYPVFWKDLIWTIVAMIIVAGGLLLTNGDKVKTSPTKSTESSLITEAETDDRPDTVFLKKLQVVVDPPKYTGTKTVTFDNPNVKAPDQSRLSWRLQFEGSPKSVWMKLNGGDSIHAVEDKEVWKIVARPDKSTLYTLNYMDRQGEIVSTPYHEMQLLPDEPPVVGINGVPQFQRLDYSEGLELNMDIHLSDDYGLTQGYLVATITKGAGESVKFREQQIPFSKKVKGKEVITSLSIKPSDFDMEPGNELYFYATAFDNRQPETQQTRTETFFFVLKDTSQVEFSLQGALGIDLMPDYFRSQLQIIIDTEKLIKDKDQLTAYEFNFESNALGYDQKQLRLKYGQFIGEEEDSGLEVEQETEPEEIDDSGENVLDEFGHNTDKENEEGQWMDKGTEHDHEHEESFDPEAEEDPLEDFMHNHEDEETATFYTQSLKSKLRAALNEMWDAELYLRLYEPEKSLPYQYKAQELLKEIRNHARIYVQRIGFDPPPVNEEDSRLTGKLKELNTLPFNHETEKDESYPAIKNAIGVLDEVRFSGKWDEEIKSALEKGGDELAGLAIEFPGEYLKALNTLRHLLTMDSLDQSVMQQILLVREAMEDALPEVTPVPVSPGRPQSEMTRQFIENLLTIDER